MSRYWCGFWSCHTGCIKKGTNLVANDLDQRHLNIIQKEAERIECDQKLQLHCGKFPDDLNFNKGSISAILICRVLHFYHAEVAEVIEQGFKKCYEWLTSGGKLFIIAYSIYHGGMRELLPS